MVRRLIAMLFGVAFLSVAIAGSAFAATGTCNDTYVKRGQKINVKGDGGVAGETALLNFNGKTIGGSTVDGFGFFKVVGNIPSHATYGTYPITVDLSTTGTVNACNVRVNRTGLAP